MAFTLTGSGVKLYRALSGAHMCAGWRMDPMGGWVACALQSWTSIPWRCYRGSTRLPEKGRGKILMNMSMDESRTMVSRESSSVPGAETRDQQRPETGASQSQQDVPLAGGQVSSLLCIEKGRLMILQGVVHGLPELLEICASRLGGGHGQLLGETGGTSGRTPILSRPSGPYTVCRHEVTILPGTAI
ncbi:hypothetical protein CYMTET_10344 [Cymbomonas tetramitiformis]|uniref:Uncharacterized protein n=1 Tax=Cymbomonas tetramitiformis TaxID=36881 RepID=A0AAE0LE35_9CHLO|nr:hypothetical protein CYMTET_10344 [Cymbomonas tetramitiformis]